MNVVKVVVGFLGLRAELQDHMAMIEKFPHRVQKAYQREFDFPFDPEK